jgi:hypothetical protein
MPGVGSRSACGYQHRGLARGRPVDRAQQARILITASGARDRDSGEKADADLAAYFDYRSSEHISWRAGYVHVFGMDEDTGERSSSESRLVFDFNYRWRLGEKTLLVDRSRLDLRSIQSADSYRIRNRLRLDHEMQTTKMSLSSYASLEAYYDSRADAVNRYRLEVGITIPSGKRVEWDFYLGRQRDSGSETNYVNGFGITLNIKT